MDFNRPSDGARNVRRWRVPLSVRHHARWCDLTRPMLGSSCTSAFRRQSSRHGKGWEREFSGQARAVPQSWSAPESAHPAVFETGRVRGSESRRRSAPDRCRIKIGRHPGRRENRSLQRARPGCESRCLVSSGGRKRRVAKGFLRALSLASCGDQGKSSPAQSAAEGCG